MYRGHYAELARYPDNTAGGIMEPRVASIPSDLTVQQATATIRGAPLLHYYMLLPRRERCKGINTSYCRLRTVIQSAARAAEDLVSRTHDSAEVVQLTREKSFLAWPVGRFRRPVNALSNMLRKCYKRPKEWRLRAFKKLSVR